jgi:hypothetical protein
MTRLCAFLITVTLVGFAVSQEAPKPTAPKGEEKKPAAPKDTPGEGVELDVHKTAERIAENAQKAGERLKEKDPGADTRKIQQEVINDIDALIKKAQEPPPPPMNSDMSPMPPMMPPPMGGSPQKNPMGGSEQQSKSPMGGTGGSSQPKVGDGAGGASGSSPKSGRRPRRERRPRDDSPMGMGDPMANRDPGGMHPMPATPDSKDGPAGRKGDKPGERGGDRFGMASPKRQNEKLADLYKDVWGHLPDRLRQEMDLYYREKFMPRYSELLRQYYAALAEQKKSGSEDR